MTGAYRGWLLVISACAAMLAGPVMSQSLEQIIEQTPEAANYVSGHQPLEIWDNAARASMPAWINYWLAILIGTFFLGVFFVRHRVEARWAVGGFVAMMLMSFASGKVFNLVPLSGLFSVIHLICWTPVLYLLLTRRPFLQGRSLYAIWSAALTVFILFSFLFDIPDAAIYLDHMLGIGVLS